MSAEQFVEAFGLKERDPKAQKRGLEEG